MTRVCWLAAEKTLSEMKMADLQDHSVSRSVTRGLWLSIAVASCCCCIWERYCRLHSFPFEMLPERNTSVYSNARSLILPGPQTPLRNTKTAVSHSLLCSIGHDIRLLSCASQSLFNKVTSHSETTPGKCDHIIMKINCETVKHDRLFLNGRLTG